MKRINPEKTALLIIDSQNDFCHPDGVSGRGGVSLENINNTMPQLHRFIKEIRSTSVKIIYVRTIHSEWSNSSIWDSRSLRVKGLVCAPNSWGADFYEIKPETGDLIITKHRYSAFIGTDLDLILRCKEIENLLCTGFITNVCVESTIRDAFMINYYTVLVRDCCAAPTIEQHEATVTNVNSFFGTSRTSKEVIEALKSQ